jgi:hypothetical protein
VTVAREQTDERKGDDLMYSCRRIIPVHGTVVKLKEMRRERKVKYGNHL